MRGLYTLLFLLVGHIAFSQCDTSGILLELQGTTNLSGILFAKNRCFTTATVKFPLSVSHDTLKIDTAGLGSVSYVAATAPAAGITITGSPITHSGTLVFALANDLAALEGLGSTGIAVRTAANTWAQRSIVAGTGAVTITNGDGVSGNITINNTDPDQSTTNEVQTYTHTGTTSYTNTLSLGGGSFTLQGAGSVSVSNTAGTVTFTGTNDGNGIYGGSGNVPSNTIATQLGTFSIKNSGTQDLKLGDVANSVAGDGIKVSNGRVDIGNVFGSDDLYIISGSGVSGNFIRTAASNLQQTTSSTSWSILSGSFSFSDSRTTKKGVEYSADYTTAIIGNARSIPDVGIVKQVYTAGTGISVTTVGNNREIANTGDLSSTNEIQTIDTFSLVSNTLRLSLTQDGGPYKSVDLSSLANVNTDLTFTGTSSPVTLNSSTGTDVTITAGGINTLSASGTNITITATEVGTVSSVAATAPASGMTITGSPITTSGTFTFALANDLAALEGLASNGIAVRTATDTWTTRTITAGTGISISNGDGVAGNPTITNSSPDQTVSITGAGINVVTGTYPNFTITGTEVGTVSSVAATAPAAGLTITGSPITGSGTFVFALANDLAAVEGLAGTGFAVRTAANTWANRVITAGTGITVSNGDGIASDVIINATDPSLTNEGVLGVGAGGASSSTLLSNTSGANAVTINVAGINTISESTSANGGSITITATEVGTVSSFSSGNLSPLFTTSVTGSTGAVSQSFTLSTVNPQTYYGNSTGLTAAPSFVSAKQLTKTDDTNVTVTLNGSPNSCLLQAASLTMGWTGTLAVARGGIGVGTISGVMVGNGTSAVTGVTGTDQRVAIWKTTGVIGDDAGLLFNYTNDRMTINNTTPALGAGLAALNIANVGTGTSGEFFQARGNMSGNLIGGFYNVNTVNAAANALVEIASGGANAGDPIMQFIVTGATTSAIGLDNSDGDKFKITPNTTTPGGTVDHGMIFTNDANTLIGVNKDVPKHTFDINGECRAALFTGHANDWAVSNFAVGNGLGTGGAVNSVSGASNGFTVTFTTGASGIVANGNIFVVTYPKAFVFASYPVFSAASSTVSAEITKFYTFGGSGTGFTFTSNGSLTASTQYTVNFIIWGSDNN